MQLLHENKIKRNKDIMNNFNMNASITMKDTSSSLEVKEKDSSNASLLLMNAVPSGDNVTTGLSAHRLKDELPILPPLVPCCEGKELQINEDLVRSGLSAISVKHDSVVHCLSMSQACERTQVQPGLVKHRNSFRSLHRPDLKRVPYLRRMTPDELEKLFRGYADFPKCHDHKNKPEDVTKIKFAPIEGSQTRDYKHKNVSKDGNYAHSRQAIFEARSRAEDVPSGMRLHGTRARLYTSVLAGARTGDQLDVISTNEDDTKVPDEVVPEDEIQLHEELQIILPPRCDDVTADSSITATSADTIT